MNKQILRLAIPNIISNLSVPLLGAVDTAILGHLEKTYFLGALAIGGVIFNFIYWGFGFLRMGTTGITAQAYGQKNQTELFLILVRTLGMALAGGCILILFQTIIAKISFGLIQATPDVEQYAREYFYIRIYAAPATLALYAIHGWFLGMQNVKYPLVLTLLVNALNLALNFIFVFGLGMKSDGVALGTVLAQYSGLFVAVALFLKTYRSHIVKIDRAELLEKIAIKKIFSVNIDIFIRTLALIFTFSYFTAKSAEGGDSMLAVNTILLQLINILAYGVDGFAFAAESLAGKYVGAKDERNLRRTIRISFAWAMGLGLIIASAFWGFEESILQLFTNKSELVKLAMGYMPWVIVAPFVNIFCFIWDGVFIGATATPPMRNSMLLSAFGIFLPAYLLLRDPLGNHSLWLALTLFMVMRGVTLTLYAKKHIYRL
ncbi:MAG: MATE family efflux transporter [bacterium]